MTPFMAQLSLFSFGFPPKGFTMCNGQLLPINQNQAMFSLLGTTFGGDGRVNFGLPNLQGRTPLDFSDQYPMGTKAGAESHTLTVSEFPAHTHAFNVSQNVPTVSVPGTVLVLAQGVPGAAGGAVNMYTTDTNAAKTVLNTASVSAIGGNQAFTLVQPYITLNYCIALQGVFPSQT